MGLGGGGRERGPVNLSVSDLGRNALGGTGEGKGVGGKNRVRR